MHFFLKEVYKLRLISRTNAICYESRLRSVMIWSFWLSVVIALTASGSGLATLLDANGTTPIIHTAWKAIAITAAVAAVIRPIYAPSRRIERCTRQCRGYQANFNSLSKLVISIKTTGYVTKEHQGRLMSLIDRHNQLETSDDCGVSRRQLGSAQCLAMAELPDNTLWWPPYVSALGPKGGSKEGERAGSVLVLKPHPVTVDGTSAVHAAHPGKDSEAS